MTVMSPAIISGIHKRSVTTSSLDEKRASGFMPNKTTTPSAASQTSSNNTRLPSDNGFCIWCTLQAARVNHMDAVEIGDIERVAHAEQREGHVD